MSTVDSSFFHAEATLPADLPCYVERRADAELLKALNAGKFTVILSSRKVGKSSLMERAFASLRREGAFVVKKELAEADAGITVEQELSQEVSESLACRNEGQAGRTRRSREDELASVLYGAASQ